MGIFGFAGMDLEEAPDDVVPKCPSCTRELRVLWAKSSGIAGLAKKRVVLCPHCRVILGFSSEVT
jgi:hypothetical protein